MHYMLSSEETAKNFLDNCTNKLNDQGFLLLTFTDASAILKIINSKGQAEGKGTIYNGKHFSMKFKEGKDEIDNLTKEIGYGKKYDFYL